jgi:hypothetical protein
MTARDATILMRETEPVPDEDPWTSLAVIAACWQDCIEEGPRAVLRAVRCLRDLAERLGASCQLVRGICRRFECGDITASQVGFWVDAILAESGHA